MEPRRQWHIAEGMTLIAVFLLTLPTCCIATSMAAKLGENIRQQKPGEISKGENTFEDQPREESSLKDNSPKFGGREILEAPTNQTVKIGDSYTLRCASDSSAQLNWYFTPDGSNQHHPIVKACVLNSAFVGIYDLNILGIGSCHLVILEMDEGLAGMYECEETTDFDTSYAFIAVPEFISPVNTAQLNGSVITLGCRRRTQIIAWTFTVVGDTAPVIIAINCETLPGIGGNYQVDMSDHSCNLIINELTTAHAGTYSCQDTSSSEIAQSAQVIYIESDPDCSETLLRPPPFKPGDAPVIFQCGLNYVGNIASVLEWRDPDGSIEIRVNATVSQNLVSTFQPVVQSAMSFGPFSCTTSFNSPVFDPPPTNHNPDMTPPNYSHEYIFSSYPVLCNITIQQHFYGSPFFNRSWSAMQVEQGSPIPGSDYWIGLDNMSTLTSLGLYKLRIDYQFVNGSWFWEEYSTFIVGDSSTNYTLNVSGVTGNTGTAPGYSMLWQDGMKFTTYDRDNDLHNNNCALLSIFYPSGGWWYKACYAISLNGSPSRNFNVLFAPDVNIVQLSSSKMSLQCTT